MPETPDPGYAHHLWIIMKSVRLLLMLLCLVIFITACGYEEGAYRPFRYPGVIDLAGWSLSNDGIINLDNEWEFYWQRFIEPDGFGKNLQPEYINVPGVWNGRIEGALKISGDGYATYRLILKNLEQGEYALKIPSLATAYRLWVN